MARESIFATSSSSPATASWNRRTSSGGTSDSTPSVMPSSGPPRWTLLLPGLTPIRASHGKDSAMARRRPATSATAQDGVHGWDCTNANMAGRRSRNEDAAPGSRTTSWDSASIAPRTSRSDSIGTGRASECHAVSGGIPENPGVHSRPSSAWRRTIAISEELSAISPLSPTSWSRTIGTIGA